MADLLTIELNYWLISYIVFPQQPKAALLMAFRNYIIVWVEALIAQLHVYYLRWWQTQKLFTNVAFLIPYMIVVGLLSRFGQTITHWNT